MTTRRSVPLALVSALLSAGTAQAALVISHDATKNVTCSGGVCQPTAQDAVLNTGDLTSMLLDHDLTVQTGNGDGTAAGISIIDGFSWTDNNRLTLDQTKEQLQQAQNLPVGEPQYRGRHVHFAGARRTPRQRPITPSAFHSETPPAWPGAFSFRDRG